MSQSNAVSNIRELLSLIDTRTKWVVTIGLYVFVDTWLTHYALTESIAREINPIVAYIYHEIQLYDRGKFMLMVMMKSLAMSSVLVIWSKGLNDGWQKEYSLVIILIMVSTVIVWNVIQLLIFWG